ncbi:SDR family NAD(P)-dependent oxidoreductase [Nonomuraea jiangxiensis]|uniref:NAD(P)-dependent dehydrogenase, short-chain alcohol dehydrogenase family n=1 Tax=Nonomuraea jiangxiensis TaxID=633440 RepID=A0A1G8QIG6_9ACTN|nr:SDR family oxidoreductase [Nonomuraea jiangxiensis]SDJ04584.1 NAD(P)-dependent dehydrogenase, short-chain alcohol dehydrogenase family [Nonomuraea jiangxiensis]
MNDEATAAPAQLAGKVALVTGATSGIGEAIARAYAREGASVVLTGRRAELGESVADEIRANGGKAAFLAADLTAPGAPEAVVEAAAGAFGGLDVLVNNAAAFGSALTHEVTEADFDRITVLNYRVPYFLTKAALSHLLANRTSKIVNVGTMGAVKSWPGASVYNSSKAALENLTRTWAHEYGPQGVNVNAISPGLVADAPMAATTLAQVDVETYLIPTIPARRLCTVQDVVAAAIFLAGPGSDYLHGTRILLDGGLTA